MYSRTWLSLKISKIWALGWWNQANQILTYDRQVLTYLARSYLIATAVSLYFLYIASDLGLFSSVSRFTFEEYEGNSAAAVGLKGMFTILFPKCFMLFVFHPKWIVFRHFFDFFTIGQSCHIQSTWFSSPLVFTKFFHEFLHYILLLTEKYWWNSWKRLVKTCGEPIVNCQKLLFMNVYLRIVLTYSLICTYYVFRSLC